jgi:hypothetical protein
MNLQRSMIRRNKKEADHALRLRGLLKKWEGCPPPKSTEQGQKHKHRFYTKEEHKTGSLSPAVKVLLAANLPQEGV